MEQLLRGPEIPEIAEQSFDDPIFWFPLRHHSPACAFHLQNTIRAMRPDCILIEGPENAQDMVSVLTDENTKPPVAFYYFYKDGRGFVSEDKEDYKCYYPFLDYSPELVALREAAARKIPARFIDLPYGEILIGTASQRGLRSEGEKQTYNDDYLLSRSQYLSRLCEKTGLREFGELWEKYFEIGGLSIETSQFVQQMLLWCGLSRAHTPQEEMEADGCLLRERYMAQKIAEASKEFQKILVVTGGFHTSGLQALLQRDGAGAGVSFTGTPVKLHHLKEEEQGVYPLSYSMEAADALNGYASGMQSPGFYQKVWETLCRQQEAASQPPDAPQAQGKSEPAQTETAPQQMREAAAGAYEAAVLHQLVSAGRKARQKKEGISSADVIGAMSMAKGLAALRGKREPGLYELRDGALSSFVKGECNLSTDLPLRILQELNTGTQVGNLCAGAPRPPILNDFEDKCRGFGLKIRESVPQEITLELFTKKKHLTISRFFYQMDFLESGFARRKKGSDLLNRRDKNRIRELWSYQFSSQVLSALIDVSTAGATVAEAARSRLISKSAESEGCREAARLLTQGFLMGFLEEQAGMGAHLKQVLAADGDFFSLTEGFSHLRMLYELQELYQVEDTVELSELLSACFQKIVQLLPSMAQVTEEQLQSCMESCLSLYQMTGRTAFAQLRPVLMEAFERLLEKEGIQPGLEGAVLGLLYGGDRSGTGGAHVAEAAAGGVDGADCTESANRWERRIQETACGYLQGTEEMHMKSAAFLRGLFYTARDFVFVQEGFLAMIDALIARLGPEAFLQLLPELRMAFGYFTPMETDRVAAKAAALHGAAKQELLHGRSVSPVEYRYGRQLDEYAQARLQEEDL